MIELFKTDSRISRETNTPPASMEQLRKTDSFHADIKDTAPAKMTTLVDIANTMLRELGYAELPKTKTADKLMLPNGDKKGRQIEADDEDRELLKYAVMTQKANAWLDSGAGMKVLMETQPDGSVELVMPMGVAPDTAGYNRNRAFQKERKTKAQARLRAKLAEKHAHHTGDECDRCFWEKA